jgi:hypothetical protein
MITASKWAAIKATARMVKVDLLTLPVPRDRRAKDRQKTKTYFRTYYPKEWQAALEKMEAQQPLLALCAAHWKADHVLGSSLLHKPNTDSDNESNDASQLLTQGSSVGRKRSTSQHSTSLREPKKKRTSTTTTTPTTMPTPTTTTTTATTAMSNGKERGPSTDTGGVEPTDGQDGVSLRLYVNDTLTYCFGTYPTRCGVRQAEEEVAGRLDILVSHYNSIYELNLIASSRLPLVEDLIGEFYKSSLGLD